jgi:hypothetical protein
MGFHRRRSYTIAEFPFTPCQPPHFCANLTNNPIRTHWYRQFVINRQYF